MKTSQALAGTDNEFVLGRKLRSIRREKGLTLQQVADQAGLSKGFVSQVESGAANPSVASLMKIAEVLDTRLGTLFEDSPTPPPDPPSANLASPSGEVRIVRKSQRKRLVWPESTTRIELLTPDLRRRLEVLLGEIQPGAPALTECYSHEGEEFGFVLEGSVEVTVDGQTLILDEGDSITYSSILPHIVRSANDRPARTLWVITPPSF